MTEKTDPSAPVMALLEALADAGETPIATLRRLVKMAHAPAPLVVPAAAAPSGPDYTPAEPKPGLEMCQKHGRSFRPPRFCGECQAEANDAETAQTMAILAQRGGAIPPEPPPKPKRVRNRKPKAVEVPAEPVS